MFRKYLNSQLPSQVPNVPHSSLVVFTFLLYPMPFSVKNMISILLLILESYISNRLSRLGRSMAFILSHFRHG